MVTWTLSAQLCMIHIQSNASFSYTRPQCRHSVHHPDLIQTPEFFTLGDHFHTLTSLSEALCFNDPYFEIPESSRLAGDPDLLQRVRAAELLHQNPGGRSAGHREAAVRRPDPKDRQGSRLFLEYIVPVGMGVHSDGRL